MSCPDVSYRTLINNGVISAPRIVIANSMTHMVAVQVEYLGGSLPVLIDEGDWEETAEEIDDIFLGDAEVSRWVCLCQQCCCVVT